MILLMLRFILCYVLRDTKLIFNRQEHYNLGCLGTQQRRAKQFFLELILLKQLL